MRNSWHEDDAFWQMFAPHIFPSEQWEAAPKEVEAVLDLAGTSALGVVLDLPCGPGRHTLEFARRGFAVTGVDRNPEYLAEARRRSDEAGLSPEWIEGDMREFCREGAYDLLVNLYTSFGYFGSVQTDLEVARHFCRNLKPGGTLVTEMIGKEILARIFRERDWWELPDGSLVLEERKTRDAWGVMDCRWILVRDGQQRQWQVTHRIYSAVELRDLLLAAGFSQVRLLGGLDGSPYDQAAERLVAVAKR